MEEIEINEEEKMVVRKILNSDIFERKNGTLMPFYNLKADQAAFLLIDSNENCNAVANSDSFNYAFKKMRVEELNDESKEAGLFYEVWLLVLKLGDSVYKTYYLTMLPEQKEEMEKFFNSDNYDIYLVGRDDGEDSPGCTIIRVEIRRGNAPISVLDDQRGINCEFNKEINQEDIEALDELVSDDKNIFFKTTNLELLKW